MELLKRRPGWLAGWNTEQQHFTRQHFVAGHSCMYFIHLIAVLWLKGTEVGVLK